MFSYSQRQIFIRNNLLFKLSFMNYLRSCQNESAVSINNELVVKLVIFIAFIIMFLKKI